MKFKRGDYVKVWWNDGMGGTPLYGVVIAAGPKVFRVKWESSLNEPRPSRYRSS